jgi:hypothetical protein
VRGEEPGFGDLISLVVATASEANVVQGAFLPQAEIVPCRSASELIVILKKFL